MGCLLLAILVLHSRHSEAQAEGKIAWRNINNLRYADDTTLMAESKEELKSLLMRSEERRVGKEWKQCQTLFFWAPESLQIVTAAMKLKDAYSLEGKL